MKELSYMFEYVGLTSKSKEQYRALLKTGMSNISLKMTACSFLTVIFR